MSDLAEYIHHEIARHMDSRAGMKAAEITAYDPNRHAIKAMLKPDEIETGWFPINTAHIGNGFGMVSGPNIGDQITVGFLDHNINNPVHLGRLHSDKEQPPVARAGEIIIQHGGGARFTLTSDGATISMGAVAIAMTPHVITITGNVDFKGGYVKAKDHVIDDTHVHIDVMPGGGTSGVPQ